MIEAQLEESRGDGAEAFEDDDRNEGEQWLNQEARQP